MSAPSMRYATLVPFAMLYSFAGPRMYFEARSQARAGVSVSQLSCHRDAPGSAAGRCLALNDNVDGRELQWLSLESIRGAKVSGFSPPFLAVQTSDPKVELALGMYLGGRAEALDQARADLSDYLAHPARQDLDVDVSGKPGQLLYACFLWALDFVGAAASIWWARAAWRQRTGGPAPAV
jgi:hypothetical protein